MSDIEVVEKIYASMAARDLETLAQLIDGSRVITQDAALPWRQARRASRIPRLRRGAHRGDHVGGDDPRHVHGRRRRDPGGSHQGTTVAKGTPFDIPEVHRWTIRDGKAVAAHFSIDTEAMLAALVG